VNGERGSAVFNMAAKRNIAETLNEKFVGFTTNKSIDMMVAKKPIETQ